MYTLEELKKENVSYHYEHGLSQFDLDKVNQFKKLIEDCRNDEMPVDGDIAEVHGKNGKIYKHAHIQHPDWKDTILTICTQAMIPFVNEQSSIKNGKTTSNASGGYWQSIEEEDLKNFKFIGKRLKTFCVWGHGGARGNGAVDFKAMVNVWEVNDTRFY